MKAGILKSREKQNFCAGEFPDTNSPANCGLRIADFP
jgi:hypothetical protein